MIFFREHTAPLRLQKLNRAGVDANRATAISGGKAHGAAKAARSQTNSPQIYHILVKAYFSGPIDPLSGMIVNLVDVDHWMNKVKSGMPICSSSTEYLAEYFQQLKKQSQQLVAVELKKGSQKIRYDGQDFSYSYKLSSWFYEDEAWINRAILIQTTKPISSEWRKKLRTKKWSRAEKLFEVLEKRVQGFVSLQVSFPEKKSNACYQISR